MRKRSLSGAAAATALLTLTIPMVAVADPCGAPVEGYRAGAVVTGQVRYVGDGDSICVGPSVDPAGWVEVRLADWFAPELAEPGGQHAKAAMQRAAMGRAASCVVEQGHNGRTYSYDRVIASCSVGGRDLGDLMRASGVPEGGRGGK